MSLTWKQYEIDAALELRSAIIGIVLRKPDELAKINIELERSNSELDAFAYIASHDLKEPLRGIHNYSSFLLEDYGDVLNEDGVSKLQTLMRLTQRMEDLIDSLLHFSQHLLLSCPCFTHWRLRIKDSSARCKDSPVKIKHSHVRCKDSPVKIKHSHVRCKDSPVSLKDSSVSLKDS